MESLSSSKTNPPATILVVDDQPANLRLITEVLGGEYRVVVANRGSRAIDLALHAPPDLILLDVMMPEMDGYEVCRRLRADPRTRDVPVIYISAMADVGPTPSCSWSWPVPRSCRGSSSVLSSQPHNLFEEFFSFRTNLDSP